MSNNPQTDISQKYGKPAGLICVVGIALLILGAITNTRQFFISYLFAYLFWFGLSMGCLLIAMIHYLTGGRWGFSTRRFMEAGFSNLPLMILLFIPLLFGLSQLYPWANANILRENEILQKRLPYMTLQGFLIRSILAFGIWIGIAWFLRKWSLEQEDTDSPVPTRRLMNLSGVGIVLTPLVATFVYVDWVMSLEIEWFSTMFPIIILAGQVLAAYAFVIIILKLLERSPSIAEHISQDDYYQLGNLLLSFVMFWTYVSFGQLLIVYSGNLPREINWYLHRIASNWKGIVAFFALFHFFVPFFILLFRTSKTESKRLALLASVIFITNIVYNYWMVVPSFHPEGIHLHWLDFVTIVTLGTLWLVGFFWNLNKAALVPAHDPRYIAFYEREVAHD